MKSATFAAVLFSFVAATVPPAFAESLAVGPEGVLAAAQSVAAPESPAAAFDRLFAARPPAHSAAAMPATVDPLDGPFHAALWSVPRAAKLARASAGYVATPGASAPSFFSNASVEGDGRD